MKKHIAYLLFLFLLTSCEKENTSNTYIDKAVVEAYLLPDTRALVHITKQIPSATTDVGQEAIDTLQVYIIHNTDTILLQHTDSGYYQSDTSFLIQQSETYSLLFYFNGNYVSSTTAVPAVPTGFSEDITSMTIEEFDFSNGFPTSPPTMPDPLNLSWSNPTQEYYLLVIKNTETTLEATYNNTDTTRQRPVFRNQPTQGSGQQLRSQQFEYFGHHYIILYHINPEYAGLYDDAGNSTQNLRQPPTNIVNGTGIFTAISADTLDFTVKKP